MTRVCVYGNLSLTWNAVASTHHYHDTALVVVVVDISVHRHVLYDCIIAINEFEQNVFVERLLLCALLSYV